MKQLHNFQTFLNEENILLNNILIEGIDDISEEDEQTKKVVRKPKTNTPGPTLYYSSLDSLGKRIVQAKQYLEALTQKMGSASPTKKKKMAETFKEVKQYLSKVVSYYKEKQKDAKLKNKDQKVKDQKPQEKEKDVEKPKEEEKEKDSSIDKKKEQIEEQIKEAEEEIKKAQEKIESLADKASEITNEISDLNQEKRDIASDMKIGRSEGEDDDSPFIVSSKERIEELSQELKNLVEQRNDLDAQRDEARFDIDNAKDRIKQLKDELSNLKNESKNIPKNMKHLHTFESFLNETILNESEGYTISWNTVTKTIWFSGDNFSAKGIRCNNGKLEVYYDGFGRAYSTALGISCDENTWENEAPKIVNELTNSNISIGGLISRPIDAKAKKEAIAIIKKYIK